MCILSNQSFDIEIKYKLKVKKHKTDPINQSIWRKVLSKIFQKAYTNKNRIRKRKDVHNVKEKPSSKVLCYMHESKTPTKIKVENT